MTSEEIKNIIDLELKSEPDLTNVFGLDLTKCVVVPTHQKYLNSLDHTKSEYLWTVLEDSEDKSGYKIFYDEKENIFGLGIMSKNEELINIGYYGTFLETLHSM